MRGIAFPKESKLTKYLSLALTLCGQQMVSQRQVQVVCGGLVYFSMFRRPTLGSLNAVWKFIESFKPGGVQWRPLPVDCRLEILRFISFLPLIRMDFRLQMHPMVTCSDASSTGGGVCRSEGLTPLGSLAAQGELRGQKPSPLVEHGVMDLQDVEVLGYISVEKNPAGQASGRGTLSSLDSTMIGRAPSVMRGPPCSRTSPGCESSSAGSSLGRRFTA